MAQKGEQLPTGWLKTVFPNKPGKAYKKAQHRKKRREAKADMDLDPMYNRYDGWSC